MTERHKKKRKKKYRTEKTSFSLKISKREREKGLSKQLYTNENLRIHV
jgi:hypothetical protein